MWTAMDRVTCKSQGSYNIIRDYVTRGSVPVPTQSRGLGCLFLLLEARNDPEPIRAGTEARCTTLHHSPLMCMLHVSSMHAAHVKVNNYCRIDYTRISLHATSTSVLACTL